MISYLWLGGVVVRASEFGLVINRLRVRLPTAHCWTECWVSTWMSGRLWADKSSFSVCNRSPRSIQVCIDKGTVITVWRCSGWTAWIADLWAYMTIKQ